jgi:hypothetical protein
VVVKYRSAEADTQKKGGHSLGEAGHGRWAQVRRDECRIGAAGVRKGGTGWARQLSGKRAPLLGETGMKKADEG